MQYTEPYSPDVAENDRQHSWVVAAGTPEHAALLAALEGYNYYRSGTTYLARGAEVRNVQSNLWLTGQAHSLGLSEGGYILADFQRCRMRKKDLAAVQAALLAVLERLPEADL